MYAKLSKCDFWLSEVVCHGNVVSVASIVGDLGKVDVKLRWE